LIDACWFQATLWLLFWSLLLLFHIHLSCVFLSALQGNPGTGKSTCAEIFGRILKALRLLSDGEVVIKTASDFIGGAVGESESKTASIIELCQGKVLLVDECYNLDDNMYGKKVLDTFVEKISGQGSQDIAVLLVGYEEPIRTMLRNQNPGLSSRFDPAEAFLFEDYSDLALLRILKAKVDKLGLLMHPAVHHAALHRLVEKKALPRFGNAREVDNLISVMQSRASVRESSGSNNSRSMEAHAHHLSVAVNKLRITLEDVIPPEEAVKATQGATAALDALCNVAGIRKKLKTLCNTIELAQKEGRAKPKPSHMVCCLSSVCGIHPRSNPFFLMLWLSFFC